MKKLSRCVWVLIRCGEPISAVLLLTGNKRRIRFQMSCGGQQINTKPAKQGKSLSCAGAIKCFFFCSQYLSISTENHIGS